MMQLFYTENISEKNAIFDNEESLHGIRVLRMHKGDEITFTDGTGNLYQGIITSDDSRKMEAKIISTDPDYGKKNYRLHLAVSPLKNGDRFEWLIEKAVEIGVDEITPLLCERTEKPGIRKDRVLKLIISAMKQSLKSSRPRLNDPVKMSEFVSRTHSENKLIAHCVPDSERKAITDIVKPASDYLILIGPEGDFTDEEVEAAIKAGFIPVHIGDNRLRTETAGITACCSVYLANI